MDKKIYKKMDKMNNLSDLKKQIKNEIKEDLKDDEEGSKWCFLLWFRLSIYRILNWI